MANFQNAFPFDTSGNMIARNTMARAQSQQPRQPQQPQRPQQRQTMPMNQGLGSLRRG
jgi:hypothetical protein